VRKTPDRRRFVRRSETLPSCAVPGYPRGMKAKVLASTSVNRPPGLRRYSRTNMDAKERAFWEDHVPSGWVASMLARGTFASILAG